MEHEFLLDAFLRSRDVVIDIKELLLSYVLGLRDLLLASGLVISLGEFIDIVIALYLLQLWRFIRLSINLLEFLHWFLLRGLALL